MSEGQVNAVRRHSRRAPQRRRETGSAPPPSAVRPRRLRPHEHPRLAKAAAVAEATIYLRSRTGCPARRRDRARHARQPSERLDAIAAAPPGILPRLAPNAMLMARAGRPSHSGDAELHGRRAAPVARARPPPARAFRVMADRLDDAGLCAPHAGIGRSLYVIGGERLYHDRRRRAVHRALRPLAHPSARSDPPADIKKAPTSVRGLHSLCRPRRQPLALSQSWRISATNGFGRRQCAGSCRPCARPARSAARARQRRSHGRSARPAPGRA